MKVLLPLNVNNYVDFNLEGKTIVSRKGMFEVVKTTNAHGTVLRVNGEVLAVFLHNNPETYLISEV